MAEAYAPHHLDVWVKRTGDVAGSILSRTLSEGPRTGKTLRGTVTLIEAVNKGTPGPPGCA